MFVPDLEHLVPERDEYFFEQFYSMSATDLHSIVSVPGWTTRVLQMLVQGCV